jgi:uroporphyrinogen decarboxylase
MKRAGVKYPKSDFQSLVQVLKGTKQSDRVLCAELLVDEQIKEVILRQVFGEDYYPPPIEQWGPEKLAVTTGEERKAAYKNYYRQTIRFWDLLGYSLVTDLTFTTNFESLNSIGNRAADTAQLSKGERYWASEGKGLIRSWADFERFPWKRAYQFIDEYADYLQMIQGMLPENMKLGVVGTLFEEPLEWIFGYEGLFYLLTDQPNLVQAVFDRVGEIMLRFYEAVIRHEAVGCIFHADDLGFKSGTFLSIDDLQRLVFPWFRKYASVAHQHGKPFFLHSCGNKERIMDILIDQVAIDGIHSFEEASYPVAAYKSRWGRRVGIIGGVDVDRLTRLDEEDLRSYLREVLDVCMRGGRYVFGSGNSIPNYLPVGNYMAMLDEARKWG